MKKIIIALLIALPGVSFCQKQDSVYQYCLVKATGKLLSKKVTIEVDFGQEQKLFSFKDVTTIKDDEGSIKNFNSVIDAINFMASKGWRVIQAYVLTEDTGLSKQNVYNYLLEKKALKQ